MSAHGEDPRISELRRNEFGVYVFTYGNADWKGQLIDYRNATADVPIAWDGNEPLAWDALMLLLLRVAKELRADWVVA